MSDAIQKAAAALVLRELSEIEARDIFGGTWGKVTVGPITPVPPSPQKPPSQA